jgi:hypothetical protein
MKTTTPTCMVYQWNLMLVQLLNPVQL